MKHIDIGTIHAFLDGELSGDALEFAASHFSLCEACSNLLLAAEGESDAVMQAFAVENAYAVPTQRIWARINNEIDLLDSIPATTPQNASIWQNALGWFGLGGFSQMTAPTAALALSVVLVAFFSIYGVFRPVNPVVDPPLMAKIENPPTTVINLPAPDSDSTNATPAVAEQTPAHKVEPTKKRLGGFEVTNASYRVSGKSNVKPVAPKTPKPAADLNAPLVEERLYLDAINELSETVAWSDEAVMRASFRVEYEQNIALMDRAINKMQKQVRRSPNDENAKRILFAAYQNKLDLLNNVSEKAQLMATLR
jgi:hypothetical protein